MIRLPFRPSGAGDGSDEDLHGTFPTQGQPAAADLQQAGTARLEHPQPGAGTNAQLGHAADPGRLAGDISHVGPFARA
jgi:hypothetical protein